MYPGWEVEERNKVKTTENIKNENVYSPDDLISHAYFGSRFKAELTFMTAGNLSRSIIYITYNNLTIIQQ